MVREDPRGDFDETFKSSSGIQGVTSKVIEGFKGKSSNSFAQIEIGHFGLFINK